MHALHYLIPIEHPIPHSFYVQFYLDSWKGWVSVEEKEEEGILSHRCNCS